MHSMPPRKVVKESNTQSIGNLIGSITCTWLLQPVRDGPLKSEDIMIGHWVHYEPLAEAEWKTIKHSKLPRKIAE